MLRRYDWTVGTHGILIAFNHGGQEYSATYLPEVAPEQGWSKEEAVASLIRKAGYRGGGLKDVVASIRLTRYQSSKAKLLYSEYKAARGL